MLSVKDVSKEYATPGGTIEVLSGVNLSLRSGDSVSITGPSGSGKSTLLYLVGALEPPTAGTVRLDGEDPFQLQEAALARFRNGKIGFVFQEHYLLPQCSVLENVLIPTLVARTPDGSAEELARELLDQVGLGSRMDHRPGEISGGERQRAALARALIRQPRLLLCDEPTGNLDHAGTEAVAELLLELHQKRQTILLVVTHNPALADCFAQKFQLRERRLQPA